MKINPNNCWGKALELIKQNVTPQQFETWFKPLVLENFDENTKTILVQVPSAFVYEYLEENFLGLLRTVLCRTFCDGAQLAYRVVTDKENKLTQDIEADPADAEPKKSSNRANQPPSPLDVAMPQEIDSQLNSHLTFKNYVEGSSNKLPRSVGMSIAEHPSTPQFNPMFIFGPSGCGKTHLINAIGVHCKQTYQKSVCFISVPDCFRYSIQMLCYKIPLMISSTSIRPLICLLLMIFKNGLLLRKPKIHSSIYLIICSETERELFLPATVLR